jgi:hypothetical protein
MNNLAQKWNERDDRYSSRRFAGMLMPLSDEEKAAIRWYRLKEAAEFDGEERERLVRLVSQWTPPVIR